MRFAVSDLLVEGAVHRHVRFDVMTVDTVQAVSVETAPRNLLNKRVRKDDVDIRCQNKLSARASDTDVLRDHLEQRQDVRVLELSMELGGHFDEPIRTRG